jgi:hypothetical protein
VHHSRLQTAAVVTVVLLTAPTVAQGQPYESVGIRAHGMAGAFVAVADDAAATWWNPAGLATGALFSGLVEHRSAQGRDDGRTFGVAFAVPSLGLSYYRLRINHIQPPSGSTERPDGDRQDPGAAGIRLPTYVLSQFGATVGQSLGDHLVVGSTFTLVRADQTRGDLDVGATGTFGPARVAIVVKRLRAPMVTAGGSAVRLPRQVRVGARWAMPGAGRVSMAVAADGDLTTTATAGGQTRHLAGGVELWFDRAVAIRGGVSINTVGDARPSTSGGVSASVASGLYVDAQITRGEDDGTRSWGLALRVTF